MIFFSTGYEGPIFHKIGNARGVNYLKIRGARGVPFRFALTKEYCSEFTLFHKNSVNFENCPRFKIPKGYSSCK